MLLSICLASFIGLISAAPSDTHRYVTRDLKTDVQIVNNCQNTLQVGQLGDTLVSEGQPITLSPSESKLYTFYGKWTGRFWARDNCQGANCQIAGTTFPASLAEFTFHADDGQDFYDVSFVDGYNLPLRIEPIQPESFDPNNKYWCGAPTCQHAPSCPSELKVVVDGVYIGCQSACSKFGTPEYCCSGDFNTPDKWPINKYASQVKSECPDAYSFAYDDISSLYGCKAAAYIITWCP